VERYFSYPVMGIYTFHFNLTRVIVFLLREEEDCDNETTSGLESSAKPNIEELEMLLEAYFVQVDGTLNKLYNVCSISLYSQLGLA
jgi:hypothetical protein